MVYVSSWSSSLGSSSFPGCPTITLPLQLAIWTLIVSYKFVPALTKFAVDPSLWVMQYPPQHFLQKRCVRSMQEWHYTQSARSPISTAPGARK